MLQIKKNNSTFFVTTGECPHNHRIAEMGRNLYRYCLVQAPHSKQDQDCVQLGFEYPQG